MRSYIFALAGQDKHLFGLSVNHLRVIKKNEKDAPDVFASIMAVAK
jgi:hypothetical protein